MIDTNSASTVLLDDKGALATLLSTSVRSIECLNAAERIPAPVRIGSRPRWRHEEILAWVRAGCPDRRTWEERRELADHQS